MKGVILIPAYKPDEQLVILTEKLVPLGLNILVVNDGSGEQYNEIFEKISDKATVVSHEKNKGKGSALKTGISYIKENFSDCDYFITADSDGQHKVEDIIKVKEKLESGSQMVLTTRLLNKKIPFRSKFGNALSSFIYTMLTARYYKDNQSGLRGFATSNCDWLLTVKGRYYDYEMNVIYHADRQKIKIDTIDIPAVYIDGNKSSHFNPITDTFRIYRQLLMSALGSIISIAVIELMLFYGSTFWDIIVHSPLIFIYSIPSIGLFSCFVNMIFTKSIFLRNIHTRDYLKIFLRTVGRFIVYMLCSYLIFLWLPSLPMIINYNIVVALLIIPEYFIIKWISILIGKTKGNK